MFFILNYSRVLSGRGILNGSLHQKKKDLLFGNLLFQSSQRKTISDPSTRARRKMKVIEYHLCIFLFDEKRVYEYS